MLTKKINLPLLLVFTLALEACAPTIKNAKTEAHPLPSTFPDQSTSAGPSAADLLLKDFFNNPELTSLIETALKNNQELSILEQEINIANNEILARQGEYIPKFAAQAGGGIEKVERFSTEDANKPTRFGRMGLATTWEVDIWKKLRNATKAAYYNYLASIEGRRYLITNLVAEVSSTYFELMSLDMQLEIVSSYVDILSQIQRTADLQQRAGRVTSLPVKRFEAEVLKNQARQYEIQQQITMTQNRMNALLGRYPQKISRHSKEFLAYKFSSMNTSVPVKLLDNRPDIRRASMELEASKLNVDVARARFYPSLSIDAAYGYEQFNSKHFDGSPSSIFYGLAANLTMPILNRRGIEADYRSANNKQVQAVYNYEKTLIQAYAEVVNQLNMINNYNKVFEFKQAQVKALNESIEISNALFRAARVDYIESLVTQRDSLEAQLDLMEVKRLQLEAYVNLYKALGGGWKGIEENHTASNY